MTEADLEKLLRLGANRLRWGRLLALAAALTLALLLTAAVLVGAARLWPQTAHWLFLGIGLLAAAVPAGVAASWRRARPRAAEAARALDQRAGLADHLTTWEELRRASPPENVLAAAFVAAQQDSTLRCARELRPARLLPVRLPAWSRALWLGIVVLAGAILMPERVSSAAAAVREPGRRDLDGGAANHPAKKFAGSPSAVSLASRLDPNRLAWIQIAAFSNLLPVAEKEKILREVEELIGGIPEESLDREEWKMLEKLRKDIADARKAGNNSKGGSVTSTGGSNAARKEPVHTGAAALSPAELAAAYRDRFDDVRVLLDRYYLGAGRER